jgi:glycosyl transferase family 25
MIYILILLLLLFFMIYLMNSIMETFQDKTINDHIDAILYINLAHRTDRKIQIEAELNNMDINKEKIIRIDAVLDKNNGHKGCCASHIKALEFAKNNKYRNVLILEDDFCFNIKKEELNILLNKIFNKINNEYDIIMFAANIFKEEEIPDIANLNKIKYATTTSGYLINNHFYDTLLQNFKEAYSKLKAKLDDTKIDNNAIDQYWTILQDKSKWYVTKPIIGKQRDSYSDIMNGNIIYKS